MKKRNRVLEAILCAALAVVVFWGYMFAAKDNGVFALEDIEGDRTALNAFAFEGLAGDDNGQIYYIWQNGELKTKYYAATNVNALYHPTGAGRKQGYQQIFQKKKFGAF